MQNGKKWKALLGMKPKQILIGIFDSPEQAAWAYYVAAKKVYGEFAKPNFQE